MTVRFLTDQIDEKRMINKAKRFLEGDFHLMINYSGMPLVNLSSPLLDPTNVSSSGNVNRADNKFLHDMDQLNKVELCRNGVRAVVETINSCTETQQQPFRTILFRRYVKKDFDLWIYQDLNISKSKYGRFKRQALLEFAQRCESYREKYHAEDLLPKFY
ncbi:ArpU family phage packaging/lysis transcriptional regulator [uncultured Lactobacillus sp.]|uniref:ArpU family phage packaging/lysis transcriptional regulator n=1 Tax=uncultured Lactobacillus sp. TaxID=153152 RepID=UPI002583D279|nr:ArpU family phage packaging/lysis transcriptional regulator [uncultured Lactobacillus sp.]